MKPRTIITFSVAITLAILYLLSHPIFLIVSLYASLAYYLASVQFRADKLRYPLWKTDASDYFVAFLSGAFVPVGIVFAFVWDEERTVLRNDWQFVVDNRFYYLRNPLVIRKLNDEDPNNTQGENPDSPISPYVRPRTRH